MSVPIHRPCPVCGAENRVLIHRQRFLEGPLGNGYDVVVCTECGTGFADGIPPQATMDRYYSEQSKYTYENADGAESQWDLKRFEVTTDQIVPHLKSANVRILDIGCATGGLLSVFKMRGFLNLVGTDPSPACGTAAMRQHDVSVRVSTFAQLEGWKERFDLILMVGVLEHLADLQKAVRIASGLLNEGGLLYCAVPDVEGLAECPNAPYQQFSIEHVNFFSIKSLRRLMAECGLTENHAWRWSVEWREGVWEPIASGLFKVSPSNYVEFDSSSKLALERYLAFSEAGDREIMATIDGLIDCQKSILVWGAGTLARRLLANTKFAQANIAAFVDSNPHLQGQTLAGRPILRPTDIRQREEPILICSITFVSEIASELRSRFGLSNRVLRLTSGSS